MGLETMLYPIQDLNVFGIFLLVRFASIFLIQTSYDPDEYWQSLEVAHKMVFGYGYLTWEWLIGIRSYFHPLVIAGSYKLLQYFELDYPELLIYLPRVLQAILSAYSDLCFYKWSGTRKWAIFSIASSWFWFYTGSRTLINSFETAITTIALSMFPWVGKAKEENLRFIWLVGLLCSIRPTASIVWLPICLFHLVITRHSLWFLIFTKYFPIGVLTFMSVVVLDSWAHGRFIITSLEFLKFNLFQGGASFYGSLPWHWYLSAGLPVILGINLIPFILAAMVILKNRRSHSNELIMLGSIVFTVSVLSFLSHKEFRFLMPLLPMAMYISSRFLAAWSKKSNQLTLWTAAFIILVGNAIPAWYLGMVHQRGTIDVMEELREISYKNPKSTSLLFLMPCHSTPLYSYLHVNVTARFLTCNPNLKKVANYEDEAETFYSNPSVWLRQNYPSNGTLPSHLITFNVLVPYIGDILSRYKTTHELFHTHVPLSSRIGQKVLIHEKVF